MASVVWTFRLMKNVSVSLTLYPSKSLSSAAAKNSRGGGLSCQIHYLEPSIKGVICA